MRSARLGIVTFVLLTSACSVGPREAEPGPIVSHMLHDESKTWSVAIPQLSPRTGTVTDGLMTKVREMNDWLRRDADRFKAAAEDLFDCLEDPPEYGCDAFTGPWNPRVRRHLVADSIEGDGLVVIRFTGFDDLLGNHPVVTSFSRAFDASTGDEIRLGDVLDRDDLRNIEATATEAIFDAIGYEFTDSDWISEGLANIESYATWWPTPEGLRVIFADYAVAAHAAGTPEIVIPWSEFAVDDVRRLGGSPSS